MDYKLAKQLKDAGFPQLPSYSGGMGIKAMQVVWEDGLTQLISFDGKYWTARDGDKWTQKELEGSAVAKIPTLSELIEACGDGFSHLWRHSENDWLACGWGDRKIKGKTPEEAVAKLYLKLK